MRTTTQPASAHPDAAPSSRSSPWPAAVGLLLLLVAPAPAQPAPGVWFSPAGSSPDYIELFEQEGQWRVARSHIDTFKLAPPQLREDGGTGPNAYATLKAHDAFRKLRAWGLRIAVEAPSIKEWDCSGRGDTTDPRVRGNAEAATLGLLRSVHDAGAEVSVVAMDEPLVHGLGSCGDSLEEVARKTARYVSEVLADRRRADWAPSLAIGDIEPYPSRSAPLLRAWIEALERNAYTPAFFHLDVDVNDVEQRGRRLDWAADIRGLEAYARSRGIPFGIIFWSGHDPEPSDQAYFRHTMDWVRAVQAHLPIPDHVVFQSWVRRGSMRCTGPARCTLAKDRLCSPPDPPYCGQVSVPVNLPEANPRIYSHTRLVDEGIAYLLRAQ